MRILIAFEESQAITKAFRAKGHEAYSCDIQPCSGGCQNYHIQGDVLKELQPNRWDIIIAHPPCTSLCVAGNHKYAKGNTGYNTRLESVSYVDNLWNICKESAKRVCFENPVGVLPSMSNLPKPKYIQPYDFGEDASKKTGLFLHELPELKPTKRIKGRIINGLERWSNQTDSGQNKLGPSPERATIRSKTYQGIAEAMAEQWGDLT